MNTQHSSTGRPGADAKPRSRHDHDHFAACRRARMKPGETLTEVRGRWEAADRCRDCSGALYEGDGGTGARCAACRRGANRRRAGKGVRVPRPGQLATIARRRRERVAGVEGRAPETDIEAHNLIKALAALPRRDGAVQ